MSTHDGQDSMGINPERLKLMQNLDNPRERNFQDRPGGRSGRGGRGGRGRGRGGDRRGGGRGNGRGYGTERSARPTRSFSSGANGDDIQNHRITFDDPPVSTGTPVDTPITTAAPATNREELSKKEGMKRKREEKDLVDSDSEPRKDSKKSRKSDSTAANKPTRKKRMNNDLPEAKTNGVAEPEIKLSKEERKAAKAARKAEKAEKKAKKEKKAKREKAGKEPSDTESKPDESKEEKKRRKKDKKDKKEESEKASKKSNSKRKSEPEETEVTQDDSAEKKHKKQKKSKSKADTNSGATPPSEGTVPINAAWNTSELSGSDERKSKFLRLLGAGKDGAAKPIVNGMASEGSSKRRDNDLEKQFDAGIRMKHEAGGKRRGLGA